MKTGHVKLDSLLIGLRNRASCKFHPGDEIFQLGWMTQLRRLLYVRCNPVCGIRFTGQEFVSINIFVNNDFYIFAFGVHTLILGIIRIGMLHLKMTISFIYLFLT